MMTSPIPIDKFYTLSNGLRVHYTEVGQPGADRPSILCLHGGGPGASGYSNFKKNLPYFAAHGYHALAPDFLGFGLSDKPEDIDYTSTLHVEAIHELLRAKNLTAVVPIGNSLGGSVALELTLKYPQLVSHLILMAPGGLADPKTFWGTTDGGVALAKFAREQPRDETAFRDVLALLVHDVADITDELVAERHPIALQQHARVFTSVSIQPTWEHLHEIACPVLCFWGFYDRFLPVSQALLLPQQVAHAKIVISNRAGHWYMLEQAADFNREVVDFIDKK
ncbi:MAG TPA: alpha/beta hydrolase [Spongiibacteraceae bacterium]|nr:alpha/beta hydrolase [Spongiibacteraceae bacterium]